MFVIIGVYRGKREDIDEFETEREAIAARSEYAMAFGPNWTIYIEER
jgi:hypothetical protein